MLLVLSWDYRTIAQDRCPFEWGILSLVRCRGTVQQHVASVSPVDNKERRCYRIAGTGNYSVQRMQPRGFWGWVEGCTQQGREELVSRKKVRAASCVRKELPEG